MHPIYERVFIGNQNDYERIKAEDGWAFVLAAKEPWHREALGYAPGKAAPVSSREYFLARREDPPRFIVNLIDAPDPTWFRIEVIGPALSYITEQRNVGKKVLICCNQGVSRSPSIGLLWMVREGVFVAGSPTTAMSAFAQLYSLYNPGEGIKGHIIAKWKNYQPPASSAASEAA